MAGTAPADVSQYLEKRWHAHGAAVSQPLFGPQRGSRKAGRGVPAEPSRKRAFIWRELKKIGAPEDLVQILPPPASKEVPVSRNGTSRRSAPIRRGRPIADISGIR